MIGFCERVLDYTAGLDRASFVASAMTYDAVLRNLELIGEAATQYPRNGSRRSSRNSLARDRRRAKLLAHSYLLIDDEIIWTMIEDAVPSLFPALRSLLETAGEDGA